MNGTYQQLRDKAISQDFIERLIIALVDVAIEVYNEPADTANHEARQAYAVNVASSPRGKAEQMRYVVVFLMEDETDAKIRLAVKSAWNAFAGVKTTVAE